MLDALARLLHRRRWAVLGATAAFALLATVFGGPVVGMLQSTNEFEDPDAPSVAAGDAVARATGAFALPSVVVLVRTDGAVTGAEGRTRVQAVARELRADPDVARVDSYLSTGSPALVSRDRRATYVAATLRADVDTNDVAARLRSRLEGRPGLTLGGGAIVQEQVGAQVQEDLARAELIAFPLLFLLSLVFFRGLVAAALPILVGGVAIVGTFLVLRVVNEGVGISLFAINLVTGLGLGLAIDYSLFIVSRYREEIARAGPGVEALRRTLTTAGRTVLFSSLTVAAAMASLLVFPQRFLYSMGIGGAAVALIAAAVALVALPALLAVLGRRVDALAPARWQRGRATATESGFWYRLSRSVMRRPGRVALATAALLVAIGLPFTSIRFTGVDAGVLPRDASARVVDEALRTEFGPTDTGPVYVVVHAPRLAAARVAAYAGRLGALPGARAVLPPQAVGPDVWRIDVIAADGPLSARAKRLVAAIRAGPAPFAHRVGGQTAAFLDLQRSLGGRLPIALALVAVTTLVILFLMTGSVVLPIKALVMNLLSLSAAFGLLVLIFQDGRLEALLAYTSQGALESTQPVLLFALAFGLSTDYGVFLLGRIKEAHDRGLPTREAVSLGLERSGRIVSAAAVLFCVAVGAVATSEVIFIKELGIGTGLAVVIDATIVRALLVPALMALLGDWNWWAPRRLRRLHARFGLSETPSEAAPA